ncbi:hypothetical protein [Flavobacterium microcysteis]|jgi:hypothetical protein|uniref:Uncharacterized protein n=1 Tax=Flavobacterium microcysteis TaxID=2596891 RepID=A0A501Q6C1_9FLAO|nr:hypothetical protein [Flavobacterium microcysteis]TPD68213.1 hypothetical protein FJA49_09090 [Flavobacterium microcysteis]
MKSFMKKLKLLGYVILIILASLAAGISGAPVPMRGKKEERNEINIEMVDLKEDSTESENIEIKK